MSLKTRNVSTWSGRPHDYLYDPCCILSSVKDHDKEARKAANNSCCLAFIPIYRRMFSEFQNSRITRMQDRKPIPWFISRKYRVIGSGVQENVVESKESHDQIIGPQLFKYFKRPRLFHARNNELAAMLYHLDYSILSSSSDQNVTDLTTFYTVDEGTQTDLRDAATQTEPYSPPYAIHGNLEPEILTLASFAWGNGLPVGEREIIMIERARIKRCLESNLPELTKENFHERLRLISEIEWSEWRFRDEQIQEIHDIKMILLKQLMDDENENFELNSTTKIARVWKKRKDEKNKLGSRLKKSKFREYHKLLEMKKMKIEKLSIYNKIDSHFDRGSELFVPLLRNGINPLTCKGKKLSLDCNYYNSYKAMLSFEQTIHESHFISKFTNPILPRLPETGYVKRKYKKSKQLDDAYKTMLLERGLTAVEKTFTGTMALMEKLEKPPPRPVTPEIRGTTESAKLEESIIFLQTILRGRAVQILMHDGKERCSDLIEELRTFHALYQDEQQMLDNKRVRLKLKTDEKIKSNKKEKDLEAIIEALVGDKIAQMLDFLSKELIRLQDERRIHGLAILAERQRRLREAEESGLRQTEERRRREEQEIFRKILNVHQKSIDLYLDEIINSSVHHTSSKEATYEVEAMANRINETVFELEQRANEIQSQEMIADILHSFLLPEIERMKLQEDVRRRQFASLNAAYDFLNTDIRAPQEPSASLPSTSTSNAIPHKTSKIRQLSRDLELASKRILRPVRTSGTSIEDWHAAEGLEDWEIYLPGQMKYYQLRNIINYEERYADEITQTHRRQSGRTRNVSGTSVFKRKSK